MNFRRTSSTQRENRTDCSSAIRGIPACSSSKYIPSGRSSPLVSVSDTGLWPREMATRSFGSGLVLTLSTIAWCRRFAAVEATGNGRGGGRATVVSQRRRADLSHGKRSTLRALCAFGGTEVLRMTAPGASVAVFAKGERSLKTIQLRASAIAVSLPLRGLARSSLPVEP